MVIKRIEGIPGEGERAKSCVVEQVLSTPREARSSPVDVNINHSPSPRYVSSLSTPSRASHQREQFPQFSWRRNAAGLHSSGTGKYDSEESAHEESDAETAIF
ncbi:uncharacterized protein JCM6883_001050 [Sporobolomyces salmoneus]|uniref:uncharacterized protein n=1 Tax=Sporobolomyces salmoneus TaxID=183962 RepID=UPI0031788B70